MLLALVMLMGFLPFSITAQAARASGTGSQLSSEQLEALRIIERSSRASGLVGFEGEYELTGGSSVSVIIEFIHKPAAIQVIEAVASKSRVIPDMAKADALAQSDHEGFITEMDELFGVKPGARTERPYQVTSSYYDAINGAAVTLPADMLESVAGLDTVFAIYPNAVVTVDPAEYTSDTMQIGLAQSKAYLELEKVYQLELTGQGITVGILDTGVDYNHPDLKDAFSDTYNGGDAQMLSSGNGNAAGKYYGRNYVNFSKSGYENIAERNQYDPQETTYGEWYGSGYSEDKGASIFYTDHGTHVAGTVAGRGVNTPVSTLGIAPEATLLAYRVLGPYGSGYVEWILSGLEDAVADGCDVINMSLGANDNSPVYPTTIAVNNLALANPDVVFCIAAGNFGANGYASMSSPGTSPLAITVGNGTVGGTNYNVTLSGGSLNAGTSLLTNDYTTAFTSMGDFWTIGEYTSLEPVLITAVDSATVLDIEVQSGTKTIGTGTDAEFAAIGSLEGKIAVVCRGQAFIDTAKNAKKYGAAAVLVITDDAGEIYGYQDTSTTYVPLFLSTDREGAVQMVRAAIEAEERIAVAVYTEVEYSGGELHSSSSRGPVLGQMAIKPDVVAPGASIVATVPFYITTTGDRTDPNTPGAYDFAYLQMTGTSMATPHVAGIAALMLEHGAQEGGWSAVEVKARLMNTANRDMTGGGSVYSVHEIGAGYVRPYEAITASGFATAEYDYVMTDESGLLPDAASRGDTASLSFGVMLTGQSDPQSRELVITLYNNSASIKSFQISCSPNYQGFASTSQTQNIADESDWTAAGARLSHEGSVTVPAGGSATTGVVLSVDGTNLDKGLIGIYEGYVTLTDDADAQETYSLPFSMYLGSDEFFGSRTFINQPMITTNSLSLVPVSEDSVKIAYDPNAIHIEDSMYADLYVEFTMPIDILDIIVAEADIENPMDESKYLGYATARIPTSGYTTGISTIFHKVIGPAYWKNVSDDTYAPELYSAGHYKLILRGYVSSAGHQYSPKMLDLFVDNAPPEVTINGLVDDTIVYQGSSAQTATISGNIYDAGIAEMAAAGALYEVYDNPDDYHSATPDQALNAVFAQVQGSSAFIKAEIGANGDFTLPLTGLGASGVSQVTLYCFDGFSAKQYVAGTDMSADFDLSRPGLYTIYGRPYAFAGVNKTVKTITLRHDGALLSVSPASAALRPGETLTVSAVFNDKATEQGYNKITWSSGNPGVASVNASGQITAKKGGVAVITAMSNAPDGLTAISGTVTVTVTGVNDGVTIPTGSVVAFGADEYDDFEVIMQNGSPTSAIDTSKAPITYTRNGGLTGDVPITTFAHQWRVMGEERDASGVGDGYLTLLSTYAVSTREYNDGYVPYRNSALRAYLNGEFLNGFLPSEQSAIPEYDVSVNSETISNQRVYLPWGAETGSYAGSIFWTAGENRSLESSVSGASDTKNLLRYRNDHLMARATYYLRGGDDAAGQVRVVDGETGTINKTGTWDYSAKGYGGSSGVYEGYNIGTAIRPVTKLDMSRVVYAYKFPSDGMNISYSDRPGLAYGDDFSQYDIVDTVYKLSVLGENDGASIGTLSGISPDPQTVTAGNKLTLGGVASSKSGDDYIVAYKIVGNSGAKREIVLYDEIASFGGARDITLYTNELAAGSYSVYIWLQKMNSANSYEAGRVEQFDLTVTAPKAITDMSDGVKLEAGGYVYYGSYRHLMGAGVLPLSSMSPLMSDIIVKSAEETATPILWQVMGEETDTRGNGDGYLTVMSRYVLDMGSYSDNFFIKMMGGLYNAERDIIEYQDAAMNMFLGREFTNSFSSAENSAVPLFAVKRTDYYENDLITQNARSGSVPNQKVYLPWGTKYADNGQGQYYTTLRSLFWSAGDNTAIAANTAGYRYNETGGVPDTVRPELKPGATFDPNSIENLTAMLKAISEATGDAIATAIYETLAIGYVDDEIIQYAQVIVGMFGYKAFEPSYWLGGSSTFGIRYVESDGRFYQGGQTAIGGSYKNDFLNPTMLGGIRPVTKIDPKAIVYAEKIDGENADGINYIEPGEGEAYYKLTVQGADGGRDVGTLSGVEKSISLKSGTALSLTGVSSSVYGADYTIAYKIVGGGADGREIVRYGQFPTAQSAQTLELDDGTLASGSYKLYVWVQKNNETTSNEAGVVVASTLTISSGGGTLPPVETGKPDETEKPETPKEPDAPDMLIGNVEIPLAGAAAPRFADVGTEHWAHKYVEYLAALDIVNGKSENAFYPSDPITRAEFVTILARMSGERLPGGYAGLFTDVDQSGYYAAAVQWAVSAGITNGTDATTFSPHSRITRQEIAVMITRYAEYMGYGFATVNTPKDFADSGDIADYAKTAINRMQQADILSGYGDGTILPKREATRAEAAKLLSIVYHSSRVA